MLLSLERRVTINGRWHGIYIDILDSKNKDVSNKNFHIKALGRHSNLNNFVACFWVTSSRKLFYNS